LARGDENEIKERCLNTIRQMKARQIASD
jgi:hypothetical protein